VRKITKSPSRSANKREKEKKKKDFLMQCHDIAEMVDRFFCPLFLL